METHAFFEEWNLDVVCLWQPGIFWLVYNPLLLLPAYNESYLLLWGNQVSMALKLATLVSKGTMQRQRDCGFPASWGKEFGSDALVKKNAAQSSWNFSMFRSSFCAGNSSLISQGVFCTETLWKCIFWYIKRLRRSVADSDKTLKLRCWSDLKS